MSASIVEFPKSARKDRFPFPIRTATGALVTIFGVRLVVSQIGVSMHRKRPLPFVAVLLHPAWSFDAMPDVIHETSGEDEVRSLLGRTAFPIINSK